MPIKAGEEILVNYNVELSESPEWYRQLWVRYRRLWVRYRQLWVRYRRLWVRYNENTENLLIATGFDFLLFVRKM